MVMSRAMEPMDLMEKAPPLDVQVVPDEQPDDYQEPEDANEPQDGFRKNLAELMPEDQLRAIATDLIELVEADDRTRSEWIETYSKGLDYLGFKGDERNQPFKGSSGVYHPVMTEAVVRFQSNAIMEIFPAAGPVLTRTLGEETTDKVKQARRIKEEMNYQLTEKMKEYRNETEQLLFRLPLAGSVFRKVYFDPLKKRPSACMVPAEDFIIDYGCSDLENSERYTHVMKRSPNQIKKLQRVGFYRKVALPKPAYEAPPAGKEKEDEITGIEPAPQIDNRHVLYEVHCYYNLPGDFASPDDVADPYIITIEKQSQKVLAIYRNWSEDDDQSRNMEQFFVHFQYMPGLGFYGIGLIHLIGGIAKGATSILRQLIDAGTLSNLPGGLKTRGLRTKGDDTPIAPGEWRDVDVPAGTIQQNIFPMPYKEPSAVLATLLQGLVDEGRRVGSIADLEVTSQTMSAPVGTTLALLERSLKVMSAVHARLHASLRREFGQIARVIGLYMPPQYEWDDTGQFNRQEDFSQRVDILPVSDPNAATQAQRIIQSQAVQQLASQNPELYNMKEVHRSALQAIGVKNDERMLPLDEPPPFMDPVSENMAILTGQPVKVYPEQDHTAHIQVHLSMATDPKILEMLKSSPSAAKVQGAMEAHLAEHLANQYRVEISQIMGTNLPPAGQPVPPQIEGMLSRAMADASVRLKDFHDKQAAQKAAEQIAKDPVWALREREVALKERQQDHKEKVDAIDRVIDVGKEGSKEQLDYARIHSQEAQTGAKIGADLVTFGATLDAETRQQGIELGQQESDSIRQHAREVAAQAQDAANTVADRIHEATQNAAQRQHEAQQNATDRRHEAFQNEQERAAKLQQIRAKPKPAPKSNGKAK